MEFDKCILMLIGSVRSKKLNSVFFEIARQQGILGHKKTGKTDFDIVFSRSVQANGIESNLYVDISAILDF